MTEFNRINKLDNDKKKELALMIFNILKEVYENKSKNIIKQSLKEYDNNHLSKYASETNLTISLYLLDNEYYPINNKITKCIKIISPLINYNYNITDTLSEYVDNNNRFHDFLNKLSKFQPELGLIEEFTLFSFWLYKKRKRILPFFYIKDDDIDGEVEEVINKEIIQKKGSFFEYLSNKDLIFNEDIVENFLLSLKVKPLVILTGNSGVGKTKIIKELAEFLDCHYSIVPIGSNWTDNHNIIGYYNPFTRNYYKPEPFKLLNYANTHKEPSFLVLDEMNLSHVEHYFSDILSSLESGVPIPLNDNLENDNATNSLELSDNLFIVGTVNIDETTYMFSPKVLDRANTIEFKTSKPKKYLENYQNMSIPYDKDIEFLINPLNGIEARNMSFEDIKEKFMYVKVTLHSGEKVFWEVLVDLLDKFYEELEKSHFDFGFRVTNEILRFMYVAWIYESKPEEFNNWNRYFDAQVKQKLLPKIHGSEYVIKDTLKGLKTLCEQYKLKTSVSKLDEMNKVLKEQKFVSFIN